MSEIRWHPLLREWVITATHRQDRTFLPPAYLCPLCPTRPDGPPTEIPEPFDIAVFENRFPSLSRNPPSPAVESSKLYPVRPSRGVCEVIVYTPEHNSTLAKQSEQHIARLIQVWTDRYKELGSLGFVKYVFIFENRGEVIGVTLSHPHGQIYAYPFIPSLIERELEACRKHYRESGYCLLCAIRNEELRAGTRIVAENAGFVAYVPSFARWPYELHIVSRRHFQALTDLERRETIYLSEILKRVLVGFDRLFDLPLPYMMVLHQRPCDSGSYDYYHFHIEFYIPLRTATKLKYLAGSESGAGTFINDRLPEQSAADLRACITGTEPP